MSNRFNLGSALAGMAGLATMLGIVALTLWRLCS